jgi:predicted DNA-binding transcriptional regulator YafY
MSGRNSQISRIYALLNVLEGAPQGLTVAELTSRVNERGHEASKRTVYRDLEALSSAGFAVSPQGNPSDTNATRWVLERLTRIGQHFVLSSRELLALYIARGVLTPLKDTPFFQDLDATFKKIELRLGSKGCDYFTELAQEFRFEPGPRWGLGLDPDLLETVRACCAERQLLSVTYASANKQEKRSRRLGPHYLYFAQGSLYLVAEDMEEAKTKVFSVPRMSDAKMMDDAYEGKVTSPESYFDGTFGIFRGGTPVQVRLAFSPTITPFVRERRWHSSQTIVNRGDGSILLSLEVSITPELVQWVLGFGAEVNVIEPDELRSKIIFAAEGVLAQYQKRKAA